jgi:hypothetical protein
MALNHNKTVLMIMMDALRHDYITPEDAPFLYGLGQQGARGSLVPSFGFEPDCAYFAGLDPEECDGGAQYWRNPNERVFHLTSLFGLLNIIPIPWWRKNLRRGARLVAQLLANPEYTFIRKMAPASEIPFSMLGQFGFSMKKLACEVGFSPSPTMFDALRMRNARFFFHGHPAYKVRIESVVSRYLDEEDGNNALAFLFIGDLDRVGHAYGPDSRERRAMLKQLDAGLARIHEEACRNYAKVDMLVFGDHGMVDVTGLLDLRGTIAEAGLDPREDAYFLDSTFARFWVPDIGRRQRLINVLSQINGGHVLTEAEKDKYHIRYPHNYFGDVIYAVEDGMLVHPSFYCMDGAPPKGMHGYLPGCRDNESAFVLAAGQAAGLGDLGRIDMRRIFPTVLDLLGLKDAVPIPHHLQSLLP